ncbi:MAG: energy-coupling factor ABC transporter permease [Chloroflexi bacterium]|nr:energy-coupling factor ABC transporter permease [Chloroflexota bacterium]MBU1750024.1 energy-coupling factor ABC transporter permease [Chloroflexota bacterium]MBU1878396.1 energy-coupling factor ABC transporter permease [Chloroflexota bacterium]
MLAHALFAPPYMHIPDGFLSLLVSVVLWLLAIILVSIALWQAEKELGPMQVPLMGVLAAVIFAGQMLNFQVAGGTSGHLMGAALATIFLGPWSAILVMTAVVATQALLFQDGGLLALGANIFNMGIVGVAVSYAVYWSVMKLARGRSWGVFVSAALGAWLSIVVASLACAIQLSLSGTSPANVSIPTMGGIHMIIGLGEALITVGAVAFVYAVRRDLLHLGQAQPVGGRVVLVGGLIIAGLLVLLSPLASAYPDGLEWVAETTQPAFIGQAADAPYSIIPDYVFPGIPNEALATVAAGLMGVIIVFTVAVALAYVRRSRRLPVSRDA